MSNLTSTISKYKSIKSSSDCIIRILINVMKEEITGGIEIASECLFIIEVRFYFIKTSM